MPSDAATTPQTTLPANDVKQAHAAGAAHPANDTGTLGTTSGDEALYPTPSALAGGSVVVPLGAPGAPATPLGAPDTPGGVDIKAPGGLGNNGWAFIEPPPVQAPP